MSHRSRAFQASDLVVVFFVAVLYVACAKLGLALAFRAAQVTAVWPPTAFALVAVFRLGHRAIPGVLLGAFIANVTTAEPLAVAAGIGVGNTLEAMAGVWILRRYAFDGRLARVRDVVVLLCALVASPMVSASMGVTSLIGGRVQPVNSAPELFWIWWLGDALGGLIFGPLLFACSDRDRLPARRGVLAEGSMLILGVAIASMFVFLRSPDFIAVEYLVFPFLIWGALRFGPMGSAMAAVAANVIAVTGTHLGTGPFAGAGPERGLVLLQVFMAVAATTSLFLGAVAAQNRAAQLRAEVSEGRLLMAMSAARIGVWEWNIETGDVLWSEGLEPMHGLPVGGFAGTYDAYRKLVHPDDLDRVDEAIAKAIESRKPYEANFRLRGPDGVVRWTEARGTVLENADGRPVRMIGVGIDVTRQMELEQELRTQDRRKDEFLAMLAHELRNPLAPILHATEILSAANGESDHLREVIRRQTRHLAHLVDDLLDVSRITRGTVILERRILPLAEVVNAAAETWRHLTAEKNQQLFVDADRSLWVDADQTRLTQAVANLVHNAAKFTPRGGRIDVTAHRQDRGAVIRVSDTGHGMSEDVLTHAFDLFVQGPPPLDRPHGGLGLGLTLVRQLIQLHDGSVEARSDGPGRGSEFVLRLPLADAPEVEEPLPEPEPARKQRRVLLVEDHDDARRILAMMLTRNGHDVRTAEDGPAALAAARMFSPEVVLLDIGLPGMDGYEVARELRAMPECSASRIIALTGYGQAGDREQSRAAGFDEHLLKPVEPANLLAIIQQG